MRAFEKAGVAALQLEDQISPKRCPAAAAQPLILPIDEAVAKMRAAVDARQDPDLLIVARTDATDPGEAIERLARYAEAGADLVQPISRSFDSYDGLVRLREACGRPLSLILMEGTWMERLDRSQIESVAAFATYPLITLMSMVHAVRANLAALADRRGQPFDALPCARTSMPDFKQLIGWQAMEQRQAQYETGSRPA